MFLWIILFILILIIGVVSAIPYWLCFLILIIDFMTGSNINAFYKIVLLIMGIVKYINRNNRVKYEYKFYNTYTNFDYDNFNRNYQEYNNRYQPIRNGEYEEALAFFGFSKDTPFEEKKKIYRQMARKYHPDLNKDKDAEKISQKINAMWDIIEKTENH